MSTVRQQILALLEEGPQDLRSLSQAVHVTEKEIAFHLPHIEKSVRQKGVSLRISPYQCRICGFAFGERHRFSKPGRCPACKNGSLEPAVYWIEK